MKMKFFIEMFWFYQLVFMLFWFSLGSAQNIEVNIAEQVEQCNALEDDKPLEAIELAKPLLRDINKNELPIEFGQLLGCLGWAQAVSEQTELARITAQKLTELTRSLVPSAKRVQTLRKAGSIFHRIGDRISAVENYHNAALNADELKLSIEKIPILINLGVLNSELRDHKAAIDYYYAALDLIKSSKDYTYQAPVLFNLAVTLNGQKRFDESIKIYHQVEGLINDNWPKQRIAQIYYGLGIGYSGLNQLQMARQYLIKSIENIAPEHMESIFSHGVKVVKALVDVRLGEFKGAKAVAIEAEKYYSQTENSEGLITADNPLSSLANLYELLNEPLKALQLYKESTEIDQKFQNSFNKDYMAQVQAKLSDSKQREELASLKSQNSLKQVELNKTFHQRWLMIIAVVFLLIVLVLFWIWQQFTNRKLWKLSMIDTLTQVSNRRGVMAWFKQHKMSNSRNECFLWLLDLDDFRKINEAYGHDVGDTALQMVAQSLQTLVNSNRCIGRWSGEEFILLTQDIGHAEVAVLADQILASIRRLTVTHGLSKIQVTVSIGVSVVNGESSHLWNRALSMADKALFVAKERGRNCMVLATDF